MKKLSTEHTEGTDHRNLDGFKRIFLFHAYAHPFNLTQIIDDYIIHLMTTIGRDA